MANELETISAAPPAGDMTLADPGIIAMGQKAEKLVAALKIIRAAVLKLTNEKDWESLGGRPYLNEGGAKKVGTAFGVSWQLDAPVREDYEDGHYDYLVSGTFEFRGTRIEEVGTRSSKDDFFSKKNGVDIPPSEIDRNDVKKGAITNCINRGVKAVLGLKNYTWEELQAAGINPNLIGKVEYGKDPNAVPTLPNYGEHKGRPMNDPTIPLESLKDYLRGVEKSIGDAAKARFKATNERTREALKAEIVKREGAVSGHAPDASEAGEPPTQPAPAAPSSPPESNVADSTGLSFSTKLRLSESVREVSDVLNKMEEDAAVSGEDRKALRVQGKQRITELTKK